MALPADPEKVIKQLRADLNDLQIRCEKLSARNLDLEDRVKLLTGKLALLKDGIDTSVAAKEIEAELKQPKEETELQLEIF